MFFDDGQQDDTPSEVIDEEILTTKDLFTDELVGQSTGDEAAVPFERSESVDVLTYDFIGVSGTKYTYWTKSAPHSEAIYEGYTAGGNSAIQLRRKQDKDSGIVTTASGGYARRVAAQRAASPLKTGTR